MFLRSYFTGKELRYRQTFLGTHGSLVAELEFKLKQLDSKVHAFVKDLDFFHKYSTDAALQKLMLLYIRIWSC